MTIANHINCFGPAPSNKWNAWNWAAFAWGEGESDLIAYVVKLLSESVSTSDTITPTVDFYLSIANTLSPVGDMGSEVLADGSGYTYVFPSDATDGEDRDTPSWSSGSASSASFTCQAAGSTTWS